MKSQKSRRGFRSRSGRRLKLAIDIQNDVDDFRYTSEDPLTPNSIPKGVKKLHLENYNHPLHLSDLPSGLKELYLGDKFNHPIRQGDLPLTLTSLSFGNSFTQEISKWGLPEYLEYLQLGHEHSQDFPPGFFPSKLKELRLGYRFNGVISPGALPDGLRVIEFGNEYNQPLTPGMFPRSVSEITLGINFQQRISEGVLPDGLKNLIIGSQGRVEIEEGALPEDLQTLVISHILFDQFDKIPPNLKSLELSVSSLPSNSLPDNLVELTLSGIKVFRRDMFPTYLEKLVLKNITIEDSGAIKSEKLPEYLISMIFLGSFKGDIESLPDSLEILIFDCAFPQINHLPIVSLPHLRILDVSNGFYHDISPGVLAEGLEEVYLPEDYDGEAFLPTTVTKSTPKTLIVTSVVKGAWRRFVEMVEREVDRETQIVGRMSLDELGRFQPNIDENVIMELEGMYRAGYPIPVEPHENTILKTDNISLRGMDIIKHFVFERSHHSDYLVQLNRDRRMKILINNWIYGYYWWFNEAVERLNENMTPATENKKFIGEYDTTEQAHQAFHNAIMMAPRVNHKIYAWRGMHGMEELCMDSRVGSYLEFSRFMACSVAQEVSCQTFASNGVLLLIELPPNTPFLNLTPMKKTEPEFLLPDRSVFQVVNRFKFEAMKNLCAHTCEEIIHIKLVGVYDSTWDNFEIYLGDMDLTDDLRRQLSRAVSY
jgi:hypothetical protein